MAWPNRGTAYRPVVMGTHGMVASAHYLASVAGLRILQQGGHAVDAAVAVAAALNVAEPYMSGAAGCGYMIVWDAGTKSTRVLDYIGPAPAAATIDAFEGEEDKGHGPKSGLLPSNLAGWLTAHAEYGRLDLATVFAPAIEYASAGVPISIKNHVFYRSALLGGHLTDETKRVFFPKGEVPETGSIIRQPLLAETFKQIVEGGIESFYRGAIAKRIAAALRERGGLITEEELHDYRPEWKAPVSSDYRGYTIACPPPPCSGFQYLQTFNLLEPLDVGASGQNTAETLHLLIEAMKLTVADRIAYAALPGIPLDGLLSSDYATQRRSLIDPNRAAASEGERYMGPVPAGAIQPGDPRRMLKECTTHFDVVDGEGNAVGVTQSLGDGFGSGIMAGDTGVLLNNLAY
jgi:gamma-glutamyltranspeptidase/glutathione hydrolase